MDFNILSVLLAFWIFSLELSAYADDRLLNEFAMIQTHDSMTGELNEERDHIMARWAQTQRGTLVDQLDCGARAFDYRPYLTENGDIFAHHGPVVIHKRMEESIGEILLWAKENPTELVIMQVSHCVDARFNNNYYSQNCVEDVLALLQKMNIPMITDCSELDSLTMEKALSAENHLLAIFGCSFGYWDPSLTCYKKDEYVCYDSWPENTTALAWQRMDAFCQSSSSFVPVADGQLWGFGANWQSSVESVILGTLHNSSLLLDEERSMINSWAADQIVAGKWKYLNMVSVDNVCHNGNDLYKAIQYYNSNYL
jgi:hypothetical protein